MDEMSWTEEEKRQKERDESLKKDEDENLKGEKEDNLQTDRERAENRKTVRRVFGRIALGFSAMMIVFSILMELFAPALLEAIPGGEGNINVTVALSSLVLYSVGIITYLILNRWVPNASKYRGELSLSEFQNHLPEHHLDQYPSHHLNHDVQWSKRTEQMVGPSRPRKLTLWMGSKLVLICLALGFVFNLITMGISYGVNLLNYTREVREITQQYLETGYGIFPEPPSFFEADPLLEVVGRLNPVLAFLLVVIGASIFEEIIFRKLLYDKLKVFGGKIFIVVSSLLFALFHLNHRQLIYTFVVGLIFAGVMYYTQKVSYCILLHMAFNFVGTSGMHIQGMSEMILWIYGTIYLGLVGIGAVFLIMGIVSAKRWATFDPAQIEVKKRRDIFINLGMIIFFVLTIAGMIGNALYFST